MILVLLGPPGVGKGTQGARISLHFGLPTISTGAMFRDMVARGTAIGKSIQQIMASGDYVSDEIVSEAVKMRISDPDCANGFLLDGYPRTVPQAETLAALLKQKGSRLTGALDFEAPMEMIVARFSGRRVCPVDGATYHVENQPPIQPGLCDVCLSELVQRPDDEPEVVRRRLEVYYDKTAPVLQYYRREGKLRTIDATAEPETVFGEVLGVLDALRAA